MKNETVTLSREFERENRYVVIKLSRCTEGQMRRLDATLDNFASACVDCVVVEHDWPEYEPVWQMIERRMTGAELADPVPPAGGEPEKVDVFVSVCCRDCGAWQDTWAETEAQPGSAHVARLQAEVERLKAQCARLARAYDCPKCHGVHCSPNVCVTAIANERDALQSELTKARELLHRAEPWLGRLNEENPNGISAFVAVKEFLAHQSAPAAKDGE